MGCIRSKASTLLFSALFCCIPLSLIAFDTSKVDSLLIEVNDPDKTDSFKVEIFLELVQHSRRNLPDALKYISQGQTLASQIGLTDKFFEFERKKGQVFFRLGRFDESIQALMNVLDYAAENAQKRLVGKCANSLGIVYGTLNQYDSSLTYLNLAVSVYGDLNDLTRLPGIYSNLGATYNKMHDYESALGSYRYALELSRRKGDRFNEAELVNNIGVTYLQLEDYEAASNYLIEVLKLTQNKEQFQDLAALAMVNLGASYYYIKSYNRAIRTLHEGIDKSITQGNNAAEARGYFYLGKVHAAQNKYELALLNFLQSKDLQKESESYTAELYAAIARAHLELGNMDPAKQYGRMGLEMALEDKHFNYAAEASQLLSAIYERAGDWKQAHLHLSNYANFAIQAKEKTSDRELLRLQAEFETEQKDHELLAQAYELEKQRNKIARDANQKRMLQVMLGSLGILFLFSMAFGYRIQDTYKKLKRLNLAIQQQHEQLNIQARELEVRNKDLEQFSMALGHDLKQPLTTVKGYATLLEKTLPKYAPLEMMNISSYLRSLITGINRMDRRIENLLEYYRTGAKMKHDGLVDLNKVLQDVQYDLNQAIEDSRAKIDIQKLPKIKGDSDLIAQLFQNLISNSIKYSKPGTPPHISILPNMQGEYFRISVQDNGIGMNSQALDSVFDLFNRVHENEEVEGQGIGLATCKRIVELHGGDIEVSSKPGEGTVFTLQLPFSRN